MFVATANAAYDIIQAAAEQPPKRDPKINRGLRGKEMDKGQILDTLWEIYAETKGASEAVEGAWFLSSKSMSSLLERVSRNLKGIAHIIEEDFSDSHQLSKEP